MSIVIVSWNVHDLLEKNLSQLDALRTDDFPFEVFVVDNGSRDGSARMVRERFPHIHLILNDYNAGFAKACNQALRLATGEVVLLLNPDMCVLPGALEKTYTELMERKDIGVLGITLRDEHDNIVPSVRRDPHLLDQLAVALKIPHVFPKLLDRYLCKDIDLAVSHDVEQVRGSYFAFRREILQRVGMLDERFFLWFEEVDFCKRVRLYGLTVRYCADVACRDFVGRSFMQVPFWKKQKMFFGSAGKFFWKWGIFS
jgi:GT2 family glycosyltransferase